MARYDHLPLVKLPERLERRKKPGFGSAPVREDKVAHTQKLRADLNGAVALQRARRAPNVVDPSLILRVQMSGPVMENDWDQIGLTVVSSDADKTLVLFSSDDEMREFRQRLDAYQGGPPAGQKNSPYNGFISSIEKIGEVSPKDRIGFRFRTDGIAETTDFEVGTVYLVDIELWEIGRREVRTRKLNDIATYIESKNGEVLDRFVGPSISMLRVRLLGELLRSLLTLEDVSTIDQPPQPDLKIDQLLELVLDQTPVANVVSDDAPLIGVIDSGINSHPFFDEIVVAAIGVPETLGTADDCGHGTRVGGVAIFGDLRAQLEAGTLNRGSRLCSAKVVNQQGKFDDRRLVPSQMREAISTLHEQFGCRIFVIALGDTKRPYDGGKIGTWAATLDELARELDIIIVVSSGNRSPRSGTRLEQAVTEYPNYLLEDANRFFEPAGATNVLTVGSLAHAEGMDVAVAEYANVRPIARQHEPSPFSRIGPGIGGAIKPDLVDIGGTQLFDPTVGRLRGGDELSAAGILTTHHEFQNRLLTAGSGTSYAAPRVAFSAGQILTRFPDASANLVRALLISSAEIPHAALERLSPLASGASQAICGHGKIDLERATFSDDSRVVLYADDELAIDHFAVYQIPIPQLFQSESGDRRIQVTLVYDPPVRHSRVDYTGVNMSFRLVRGCSPEAISEHYRKRTADEGPVPEIADKYNCKLLPGPQSRELSTVQRASVTYKRDLQNYGDSYYLVVRCESGWFGTEGTQRFAAVVELSHSAQVRLYDRIRQPVRVQI
jgi:hypothetical protein